MVFGRGTGWWNSRAKGLAAEKSVLPTHPPLAAASTTPRERKRGVRRTRGDVPPSLIQWRKSGGELGAWSAGSPPRTRPFGRTTGPAAEPSSAARRRRVGQSIARNTSGWRRIPPHEFSFYVVLSTQTQQ